VAAHAVEPTSRPTPAASAKVRAAKPELKSFRIRLKVPSLENSPCDSNLALDEKSRRSLALRHVKMQARLLLQIADRAALFLVAAAAIEVPTIPINGHLGQNEPKIFRDISKS
jgi:hypothetical protein